VLYCVAVHTRSCQWGSGLAKDSDDNKTDTSVGPGLWTARDPGTRDLWLDAGQPLPQRESEKSGPFTRAARFDRMRNRESAASPALDAKADPRDRLSIQTSGQRETITPKRNPEDARPDPAVVVDRDGSSTPQRVRESPATMILALVVVLSMLGVTGLYLAKKNDEGLLTKTASPEEVFVDADVKDAAAEMPVQQPGTTVASNAPKAQALVESAVVTASQDQEVSVASANAPVANVPEAMLEKAAIAILARFDSAEQDYEEILSIDPRHPEALAGMAILRERQLRRVNQVINRSLLSNYQSDVTAIGQSLGIAQGLVKSQLDDLSAMCLAIDRQIGEARNEQFPWWIALANRRIRDGILTQPETGSALYAFRRAESIDATSTEVLSGLEKLRLEIVRNSGDLLDSGETAKALADLNIAQEIRQDPSTELLIKQIRLSEKKKDLTPESFVNEADALITQGRLVGEDSALAVLNRAIVLDPDSKIVSSRRRELAERLVERAESEADEGELSASAANLRVALALEPDNRYARQLLEKVSGDTINGRGLSAEATENSESRPTDTVGSLDQVPDSRSDASSQLSCERDFECIGIAVDEDDSEMSKLASEFSAIVTGSAVGTIVKPTGGPVASTVNLLSKNNAGLSVLPSDMLRYTDRSDDPVLSSAARHLRYIMSLGQMTVYLIANSTIKSPADLAGKHVVLGPRDDDLWVVASNLLHAYGVDPGYVHEFDSEVAVTQLVNGRVDAVFLMQSDRTPLSAAIRLMLEDANREQQRYRLVSLPVPSGAVEYESDSVTVSGLGEGIETITMKPILVSYDFAQRDSGYFRQRCDELAQVGSALISQIDELRDVGHPAWSSADWVSQCGDWQRDECFFRDANSLAGASIPSPAIRQPGQ